MKYQLIIFDVDGTILDTSKGLKESAKYTIKELGFPVPKDEILDKFVGPRIQDSLKDIYNLEGEKLKKASEIFRNHYKKGNVLEAIPYPGLVPLLEKLKTQNVYVMIATNKRQDFVESLVQKFELEKYFDKVYGTDFDGKLKKIDLIKKCIDYSNGCPKSNIVMIGDSDYDAVAANEAGIDFVGVLYGYGFKNYDDLKLWNPIGIAKNLEEISKIII